MSDKFDWDDENVLVVQPQLAVAVYSNPKGAIVIRQQGDPSQHDEDAYIIISRDHVPNLIAALQRQLEDEA